MVLNCMKVNVLCTGNCFKQEFLFAKEKEKKAVQKRLGQTQKMIVNIRIAPQRKNRQNLR